MIFCKDCKFIQKPTGAEYTPHPDSTCQISWQYHPVTEEKIYSLCKEVNKKFDCINYLKFFPCKGE